MAHKGVHATKVSDIAHRADIGVGTFYLHFETKEALFDAMVADTVRRLKDEIDEARRSVSGVIEQIRASTAALCRFASANREVFRVVFGHSGTYLRVVREAQELFAADIEVVLAEGMSQGLFTNVTPRLAAQAIIGMSTQLLAWCTEHADVPLAELEHTLNTLTLDGMCRAPA